jgi:4-amino-4-deoxy-L-arabinose transferase-like glycosyltransferase
MAARAPQLRRRAVARPSPRRAADALRRMPAAAWVCALAAILNGAAWSLVTPAFQIPDEQAHYAYAAWIGEHGRPPVPQNEDVYSDSETVALRDLRFAAVRFVPDNGVLWSPFEQRRLARDLRRHPERAGGNGGAYQVGGEPPLYYALQAIPYRLAGGTVLDRLALMRLLSALLGGVTVLCCFLFVRELLPGRPWSWTVGALGVAFQPLFGYMSGGVNADALLYAASAALLFLLARAFRRGLTPPLAVAFGAATAAALLAKLNAVGLVPGAALGLLAVGLGQEGVRLRALRLPALALAVAAGAMLLLALLNTAVWERPTFGASENAYWVRGDIQPTLGGMLSYVWQFYVVPLPGSEAPIGGFPLWESWIRGFVGLFGWIDTEWRQPVYDAALVPLAALAALVLAALVHARAALRRRLVELAAYAFLALTFAVFVAIASYVVHLRFHQNTAQVRYLLPLLPLYAGLLALAACGAGRRWMPVLGSAIVVLAIAHDVFAQLLVVARYYA